MYHPHELEERDFGRELLWDASEGVCCAAFQLGACQHTEGRFYEYTDVPEWWDADPSEWWANASYYEDRENFDEYYGDEIDGFAVDMRIA